MSGVRMLRAIRGGKKWEPPQLITVTLKHSAICRVCEGVIPVDAQALHMTWGVAYAHPDCGWDTLDELRVTPAWLAVMGQRAMTEVRANWLEVHGYCRKVEPGHKLEWTALGLRRRDEFRAVRGSAGGGVSSPSPGPTSSAGPLTARGER